MLYLGKPWEQVNRMWKAQCFCPIDSLSSFNHISHSSACFVCYHAVSFSLFKCGCLCFPWWFTYLSVLVDCNTWDFDWLLIPMCFIQLMLELVCPLLEAQCHTLTRDQASLTSFFQFVASWQVFLLLFGLYKPPVSLFQTISPHAMRSTTSVYSTFFHICY